MGYQVQGQTRLRRALDTRLIGCKRYVERLRRPLLKSPNWSHANDPNRPNPLTFFSALHKTVFELSFLRGSWIIGTVKMSEERNTHVYKPSCQPTSDSNWPCEEAQKAPDMSTAPSSRREECTCTKARLLLSKLHARRK